MRLLRRSRDLQISVRPTGQAELRDERMHLTLQQTNKGKRVFAGHANHSPWWSVVWGTREKEEGPRAGRPRTGPPELLSCLPPIGPNLMGLSQGPAEDAWGHVGPSAPLGNWIHLSRKTITESCGVKGTWPWFHDSENTGNSQLLISGKWILDKDQWLFAILVPQKSSSNDFLFYHNSIYLPLKSAQQAKLSELN